MKKNRLLTFADWTCEIVDKEQLAMTGFYSMCHKDYVRCNFCSVTICDWEEGDEVLSEHKKWSPMCPLITNWPTMNIPIDQDKLNEYLGIRKPEHKMSFDEYLCKREIGFDIVDDFIVADKSVTD